MSRVDKKQVVGAVVLAAIGVFVVLRAREGHGRTIPARAVVHVLEPAGVADAPIVAPELVRPLVPLIAPDADVAGDLVTVIGRVIDNESGRPIAGASVEHASSDATAQDGVTTSTDEEGVFRFESRANEPERMSISASGHATLRFGAFDQVRRQGTKAGEVVRLRDVRLRRGVQPVVRVLDASAKPVAGAQLMMCESPLLDIGRTTRALGVTDEHGEWTATEALAGSTSATFVLAGRGNACGFAPLAAQAQGSRGQLLEITLRPALELEVHAITPGPLAMPVPDASIGLSVMPGREQGLWLATVRLNHKNAVANGWLRAKTGPDGIARLWMPDTDIAPDEMELEASLEGFENTHTRLRKDDFGKPLIVRVNRIAEPAVARNVAGTVTRTLTSIRGRVVDGQGKPLGGIPLRIERDRADDYARSRSDGSFCIPVAWSPTLHVDELKLSADWPDEASSPFLPTTVAIGDTQHVDVVMKPRPVPSGRVHVRVLDARSDEVAPVVSVLLVRRPMTLWNTSIFPEEKIVSDLGSLRVDGLEPGFWDVAVISSDGRVGSAGFEISEAQVDAEIEVRVGPMRSIIARVILDPTVPAKPSDPPSWASVRIAPGPGNVDILAMLLDDPSDVRRTRVADDGTFTIDHLVPGPWTVVVDGPRGHSERTVLLTTSDDARVTMYAKQNQDSSLLQLTNLDSRFDGPLYVRLEREETDPVEFVADPTYGSAQTFSVMSGKSRLVVYTMHDAMPDVDKLPITRRTLDIPVGETCVVALYPR